MRSRGELKIEELLQEMNVPFQTEYSFKDLKSNSGIHLRFDFVVFDDENNIDALIEFQGEQHYRPKSAYGGKASFARQQSNDNKKRRYCQAMGYNLIEIPYTDETILNYDYLCTKIYD